MSVVAVSKSRLMEVFLLVMASIVLVVTALAVVYSKNQSRALFKAMEEQGRLAEQYEVEWGQLQLELSTLAEQNRVEQIAKERLKLIIPEREKIIYIKP